MISRVSISCNVYNLSTWPSFISWYSWPAFDNIWRHHRHPVSTLHLSLSDFFFCHCLRWLCFVSCEKIWHAHTFFSPWSLWKKNTQLHQRTAASPLSTQYPNKSVVLYIISSSHLLMFLWAPEHIMPEILSPNSFHHSLRVPIDASNLWYPSDSLFVYLLEMQAWLSWDSWKLTQIRNPCSRKISVVLPPAIDERSLDGAFDAMLSTEQSRSGEELSRHNMGT